LSPFAGLYLIAATLRFNEGIEKSKGFAPPRLQQGAQSGI